MTTTTTITTTNRTSFIRSLYEQIQEEISKSVGASTTAAGGGSSIKSDNNDNISSQNQLLILLAVFLSAGIFYERQLQRRLTRPPIVLGQLPAHTKIRHIYEYLSSTPDSILRRKIIPSFVIGARPHLSSTIAYLRGGTKINNTKYLRFREIITMALDGAQLGLDWEIPHCDDENNDNNDDDSPINRRRRQNEILKGPIRRPVILILHGINNHSRFGYIQSLQRELSSRGFYACAMNFRGCGGVPMTTPRSYHAAYTGDVRNIIHQLSSRMAPHVPIFLIGNSLGANVITKYLGEEGLANTLPSCVAGGISLGNPLLFNSDNIKFPFSMGMGLARKLTYLEHWHTLRSMKDTAFQTAKRQGLMSATLGQLDKAAAPLMIRNDPHPPYGINIGYESGHDYWMDSGCYRVMRFINVPFLMVSAEDDFLCYKRAQSLLNYATSNPNIMIVETRTGGHLGWFESSPDKQAGLGGLTSWSDVACGDFIEATLKTNHEFDDPIKEKNPHNDDRLLRSRL